MMKLKCLQRLTNKTNCEKEITEWLVSEKLLSVSEEKSIYLNKSISLINVEIHNVLSGLLREERVQLLDYTWNILPVEQIRITIVSDKEKREFTYGV